MTSVMSLGASALYAGIWDTPENNDSEHHGDTHSKASGSSGAPQNLTPLSFAPRRRTAPAQRPRPPVAAVLPALAAQSDKKDAPFSENTESHVLVPGDAETAAPEIHQGADTPLPPMRLSSEELAADHALVLACADERDGHMDSNYDAQDEDYRSANRARRVRAR